MIARSKILFLLLLTSSLAVVIIDTTLLNVSISVLTKDLSTDISRIQWVISTYTLLLTSLSVAGGRIGDIYGRRLMFLVGVFLFGFGSLIASLSTNVWQLLIGESVIEGIGAALMLPATTSLLIEHFKGQERAVAFGVWGAVAAASSAVGPILGGALTTLYSWRWGFRINVIVAILVLVLRNCIPHSARTEKKTSLDLVGVCMSAIGIFLIVFGCIEAQFYGWFIQKIPLHFWIFTKQPGSISVVPYAIVLGCILLSLLMIYEQHLEESNGSPLIRLQLFFHRGFRIGTETAFALSLGSAGVFFVLPAFLQTSLGYSALDTGLSLLPLSVSAFCTSLLSGMYSKKIQPSRQVQIGLGLASIGVSWLTIVMFGIINQWTIALPLLLYGIGTGLMMSQLSNVSLSSVPESESGEASGVSSTLRQLGSTIGSSLIGSILLTAPSLSLGVIHALSLTSACISIAFLLSLRLPKVQVHGH